MRQIGDVGEGAVVEVEVDPYIYRYYIVSQRGLCRLLVDECDPIGRPFRVARVPSSRTLF